MSEQTFKAIVDVLIVPVTIWFIAVICWAFGSALWHQWRGKPAPKPAPRPRVRDAILAYSPGNLARALDLEAAEREKRRAQDAERRRKWALLRSDGTVRHA